MNKRKCTALALALFSANAVAETYRDTGARAFLDVGNAYNRASTGVAVPNIVPGDEVQIVCDAQFTLTAPGETVRISSKALAIQVDGVVAATVLPPAHARVSYETRYWPVNRTGIWVSDAFYTDMIFTCEYQAIAAVKGLPNLGARTLMWVSRRAPQ